MSRFARHCLTFCAVMFIAGCAQMSMNRSSPAPVVTPEGSALAFAQHFGALPADGQKKELAQVTQSLSRNQNDPALRMRAALIYSLPASRHRNNERALALLDALQRDMRSDADARMLAGLLKDYVSERQKLENNAAKAGQKAAEEQKRAENLQQKLDELKNIEKAMTERYQTRQK